MVVHGSFDILRLLRVFLFEGCSEYCFSGVVRRTLCFLIVPFKSSSWSLLTGRGCTIISRFWNSFSCHVFSLFYSSAYHEITKVEKLQKLSIENMVTFRDRKKDLYNYWSTLSLHFPNTSKPPSFWTQRPRRWFLWKPKNTNPLPSVFHQVQVHCLTLASIQGSTLRFSQTWYWYT